MAGMKIEFWRTYFQNSEHDLFTIIDRAITVAALDFPDKLKEKRDGFAEKLFSRPDSWEEDLRGSVCRYSGISQAEEDGQDEDYILDMGSGNRNAELSEEELQMKEVEEIKKQLVNHDKTDDDVLELLSRLTKLQLSIETLKATAIGRPVNALRKHNSAQIRTLARKLIRTWKVVADEWAKSLDNVQASLEANHEECGLPTPPIDNGELLAALDMSPFMDLIENDMASGCSDIITTTTRSHTSSRASHSPMGVSPHTNLTKSDKRTITNDPSPVSKHGMAHLGSERARETAHIGSEKASGTISKGPGTVRMESYRKERPQVQQRPNSEPAAPRRTTVQSVSSEEVSIKDRLAAAKRKLQEGYQQAQTAKKQRTVQVMDLVDLPKGPGPKAAAKRGPTNKSNLARPGSHRR